ncbi:MAG: ABC transporter ATP-binding protein [Rhodospirillales bacterium]|nr:ABC transporter ATP-binding protein [Rhodospirillales bacterium]
MSASALLRLQSLGKRFGPFWAVRGVSFALAAGEILGFLGPNGAGKSTTMKMAAGFLPPSEGRAEVCGADVAGDPLAARRSIGYLPEGAPLYGDMTPSALLDFVAAIRRIDRRRRRRRKEWAAESLDLKKVWRRPIDSLSKGYKRRVGLAQALLHDPQLLILDEPTDGLDPNQKHEVRRLLTGMAAGKAIVISTHFLEEVTAICTRAAVIAEGRLLADKSPAALFGGEPPERVFRRLTLEQPTGPPVPAGAAQPSPANTGKDRKYR